jgi:hypothetical protein
MEAVEMIALIPETPDDAHQALRELKRLERAGWIDLTYYALLESDPGGTVHVEAASDPAEAVNRDATDGLAQCLIRRLFGPVGTVRAAAGAAGSVQVATQPDEQLVDGHLEAPGARLQLARAALMVVLEQRYSERVSEELESRGRTLHQPLDRSERLAALRASIARLKTDVKWLEDYLRAELNKAGRINAGVKEDFEATIAAARAELGAQREKLNARWRALDAELEADLADARKLLEEPRDADPNPAESRIYDLENAILECNEELSSSVLDHMDWLAAHAADLEDKATRVSPAVEAAIEAQLHELEVRMRKHRAELTAALGSSAQLARRCIEQLRVRADLKPPELRQALQQDLQKLDHRHALLKSSLRKIEKEDTLVWQDLAAGIRQSWQALCDSVAQAKRQFD